MYTKVGIIYIVRSIELRTHEMYVGVIFAMLGLISTRWYGLSIDGLIGYILGVMGVCIFCSAYKRKKILDKKLEDM